MDELSERILNAALELAERNGYEAVRMRDLAEKAEVALGTVYRRFTSKEEVLAGLLEREAIQLEAGLRDQILPGTTPAERLDVFFQLATMGLLMRPKLARAMLRTVASGEPELAQKVLRFHGMMTGIILGVMRGPDTPGREDDPRDVTVAHFLQQIWFGGLVGWAGGLHPPEEIGAQVANASRMLLLGKAALTVG